MQTVRTQWTCRSVLPQYCARRAFLSGLPSGLTGIESANSTDLGAWCAPLCSFTNAISSSGATVASGPQHDDRLHGLAPLLVGHTDHRALRDRGMHCEHVLDLAREHVEAPADDHVLLAVDDRVEAVLVLARDVAGVQPAAAKASSVSAGFFQ